MSNNVLKDHVKDIKVLNKAKLGTTMTASSN